MAKTVLGIFSERDNAESAILTLKDEGYNPEDISIVMKDVDEGKRIAEDTGGNVLEDTTAGATAGAVLGGIGGLLASFVIPGLGAFFIGGPIAAALGLTGAAAATASGAVTGALAGGLLGALTGFGLSEEEAKEYESRIKEGGILIAVPTAAGEEDQVESILRQDGADQVRSVNAGNEMHATAYDKYSEPAYATVGTKGGKARAKAKKARKVVKDRVNTDLDDDLTDL